MSELLSNAKSQNATGTSAPRGMRQGRDVPPNPAVGQALHRLAIVAHDAGGDTEALLESILTLLAETLDVGLVHVSRIEGDEQQILRVHNRSSMPIQPGDVVPLCDSYCQTIARDLRHALVVEDTSANPLFAALPVTEQMGIGSYVGVPLYRDTGDFYGTLCTLHTRPRDVPKGEVELLSLAGRVVMQALEAQEHGQVERRMTRAALEEALASEQAARVRAEEALRQRNDFLTRAAHELRTPLTVMQLQLQVLGMKVRAGDDGVKGSGADRALVTLTQQTRRLIRIANDLVATSTTEGEPTARAAEAVDLAALTREAAEEFRLPVRGPQIVVETPEPVVGIWQAAGVKQAISNLLANAVKFGQGKPVHVAVLSGKGDARVIVRDGGCGIAPRDQERIFGVFEQVKGPHNVGGLGLGLFVAKQLAEAQGGAIELESAEGEGSIFTLRLPLTRF